jgi:hypothetical protein
MRAKIANARGGQGVSWRGARSRFIVRLNDKCRQMHVPGSVLRAEVSLRGEQLARRLPGHDWRNFDRLWETFRDVLITIPAIQRPQSDRSGPDGHWSPFVGKHPQVSVAHLVRADSPTKKLPRGSQPQLRLVGCSVETSEAAYRPSEPIYASLPQPVPSRSLPANCLRYYKATIGKSPS